jgi:hypothetical protein
MDVGVVEKFLYQLFQMSQNLKAFSEEKYRVLISLSFLSDEEISNKALCSVLKTLVLINEEARECFECMLKGRKFSYRF